MRETSATLATRVRHECNTSATRVRHECDTSATRVLQERHECYTNETSAIRVKKSDFDSDASKNIFLHPHIYYMASERLQGEEQSL